MTRAALFASIVLGIGSLALGYARGGQLGLSMFILALGAIWFFAQWHNWQWSPLIGLALAVFSAAVGLMLGINYGWMFAGTLFSLLAWDLAEFGDRLRLVSTRKDAGVMEKRHFIRLGFLAAAGIILVSLTMSVHWQFSFGWLVLLALAAALGLTQLVAWFRQS